MRDDPTLRVRQGFVDPLYMIFFAVVGLGLALISPILDPLLNDKPILLWRWICLGVGIAVLAGCVAFLVREHKQG
jgi:hypothetical protein